MATCCTRLPSTSCLGYLSTMLLHLRTQASNSSNTSWVLREFNVNEQLVKLCRLCNIILFTVHTTSLSSNHLNQGWLGRGFHSRFHALHNSINSCFLLCLKVKHSALTAFNTIQQELKEWTTWLRINYFQWAIPTYSFPYLIFKTIAINRLFVYFHNKNKGIQHFSVKYTTCYTI